MTPIDTLMDIVICRPLTQRELALLEAQLLSCEQARVQYIERCEFDADLYLLLRPQATTAKFLLGERGD